MNDHYRNARAQLLEVLSTVQRIADGGDPIDCHNLEALDPLFMHLIMHLIDARIEMELGRYDDLIIRLIDEQKMP